MYGTDLTVEKLQPSPLWVQNVQLLELYFRVTQPLCCFTCRSVTCHASLCRSTSHLSNFLRSQLLSNLDPPSIILHFSSKIVRVEQKPTVILRSSEMFLTVSLLNEQKAIKRSVVKFDRSILFYPECKIFWRFGGKGQQKGYPFHFHHLRKVCNSYWHFVWLFRQPWLKGTAKFWPTCSRVDDRYGDQHLVCSCPPLESYDYEKTKSFA